MKNTLLRNERRGRGWTQVRLSVEAGIGLSTVERAERGESISPDSIQRLCACLGKTAEQLGLLPNFEAVDKNNHTSAICIEPEVNYHRLDYTSGSDTMNKKRRELFRLLGIAGSALVLPFPDVDWVRIESAVAKPSHLDAVVLNDLTSINGHYWKVFRGTSSKEAVLDGALGQLKVLVELLKDSHIEPLHKQLCLLASDVAQLSGEIFFDCNDYDAAQSCYTFAASAAKEAKDYDYWACALIRHAFLPMYDNHQYQEALPLLQAAQKISCRGNTALVTRFWVAAVSAEAQAGVGNLYACQQALDIADGVRNTKDGMNETWLRFDGTRLPEERGACYVKLKQPDLAIAALQDALKNLSGDVAHLRRRTMVLTDLTTASIQSNKIDQACVYANHAIDLCSNLHQECYAKASGRYTLS
jgi:transcriptional regulator with XRE-family HTH domain